MFSHYLNKYIPRKDLFPSPFLYNFVDSLEEKWSVLLAYSIYSLSLYEYQTMY